MRRCSTARVRDLAAGLAAAGRAAGRPGRAARAAAAPTSPPRSTPAGGPARSIVVADAGLGLRGMGRALRGAGPDHVIGIRRALAAARAIGCPGAGSPPAPLAAAHAGARSASRHDARRPRRGSAADRDAARPRPAADDEAAVVFTSGATGPAKGVVYRHRQVQAQLRRCSRATYGVTADDRLVAAFAPFALYGPALGVASAVPDMDVTAPGTLTAAALADAVDGGRRDRRVRLTGRAAQRRRDRRPTSPTRSAPRSAASGCCCPPARRSRPSLLRAVRELLPQRRRAHAVRHDRGAAGDRHLARARSRPAGPRRRGLRRAGRCRASSVRGQPARRRRRRPTADPTDHAPA